MSAFFRNSLHKLLFLFVLISSGFVSFNLIGPNADEGIYIIAGLELPNGFSDSYSDWHNGSPFMWAITSGFIYQFLGLVGVRLFTVLLSACILWFTFIHVRTFLDEQKSIIITTSLALLGPFWSFAQLGVYDIPALFFFMASTALLSKRNFSMIIPAAVLAGLSIITKYAMIIQFPVLIALIWITFSQHKWKSMIVFSGISGIVVLIHNLIVFGGPFPVSYSSYESMKVGFNSLYAIGIILFISAPLLILFLFRPIENELKKRYTALFIAALCIWPLFHVFTENPVSAQKHLIFAFAFSAPYWGQFIIDIWKKKASAFVGILFAVSVLQFAILSNSWMDVSYANTTLKAHVKGDDTIVTNVGTYRTRMVLFDQTENISQQIINHKFLERFGKTQEFMPDFILWGDTQNEQLNSWLEERRDKYEVLSTSKDFFIGADDHLYYGPHHLTISVYKKKVSS